MSYPLYANGLIWVSSQNGYLFAINPQTLQQAFKPVDIGSRMDGSPTLVYGANNTPYIAVGTASAPNNQGGTGTLYLVSLSGQIVSHINNPAGTGTAIASSPVYTGGGVAWNDISGNVFWAQISGGQFTNVRTWTTKQSGLVTNLEPGYYGGYFILPQSTSDKTEVVNVGTVGSPIEYFTNKDGANNVGSPEISANNVYVPDGQGNVNSFPVSSLGTPSTAQDNLAFAMGFSSSNLTNANEQMLPAANGQTLPTLSYETSAGLQIWQNTSPSSVTLSGAGSTGASSTSTVSASVGGTVTLDANGTSIPIGDAILVTQTPTTTPGTLTSQGQGGQTQVVSPTMTTFNPSYQFRPTATSSTAQSVQVQARIIVAATGQIVGQASNVLTVTWAAAATLSLTVTPTASQTTGQAFQLTAGTTNAAGDHVVFTQSGTLANNGGAGTLSGNFQSNQSSLTYPAQTSSTYQYNPTATSSQTGTETVTATLLNSSNQPVLNASGQPLTKSVSVTWNVPAAAPSITLAVSPTTSQVTGASFTLTATAQNIVSGEVIQIAQTTSASPNTLSGGTYVQWVSPGAYASYVFHTSAVSSAAQTVTYQASIYTVSGQLVPSNAVSAQWGPSGVNDGFSSTQNGSLTDAAQTATGSSVNVQVVASPRVVLTLSAQNVLFAQTGTASIQVTTDQYGYASMTVDEQGGQAGLLKITASSDTAYYVPASDTITWPASNVTLTATANGQNYGAGQTASVTTNTPVSFAANVTNPPANNYTLEIADLGGNSTLGGQNSVFADNASTLSAQANSASALTDQYEALLILNQTGQEVPSGVITVDWGSSSATPPPSSGPTLTLSAASPSEPVGTQDQVTAAGTNVPSGDTIVMTQINTNGGDTFGSAGSTTGSGQYQVSSTSDPYTMSVSDVSGQNGYQATYGAIVFNGNGQNVAQSSNVAITWGVNNAPPSITITATPQTLQINNASVLSVSASNVPMGDYVIVYPNSPNSGTWWTNSAVFVGQQTNASGSYNATASVSQSQPTSVTYYAVVENPSGGNPPSSFVVANNVTVTWNPPAAGVSLSTTTPLLAVGQTGSFTMSLSYLPSGYQADIFTTSGQYFGDYWNYTGNYFSGNIGEYVPSPASATTEGFYAVISNGAVSSSAPPSSNYIAITWQLNPTVTMTATPTNLFIGQTSQFLLYPHNIPTWPPFMIGIEDVTTGQIVYSSNNTQTTYDVSSAVENQATTQVYAPVVFAAGATTPTTNNIMYTGPSVTAQWTNPTAQITASAPSYLVGQQATLTASTPNMPSGSMSNSYELQINDQGQKDSLIYYWAYPWGYYAVNTLDSTESSNSNPFSGPAVLGVAGSDSYTAQFKWWIGTGDAASANSAPVTVTWGNAPSGISLTAAQTNLAPGQSTTLTATTTDVPAGFSIKVTDLNGAGTLSGTNTQTSSTSPFSTSVYSANSQTVNYQATLYNASNQVVATSGTVSVTWIAPLSVSLSANPTSLYVGQSSSLTAQTVNMPAGDQIVISDVGQYHTLSGANTATSGSSPFQTSAVSNSAGTDSYVATIVNNAGQTVATSSTVSVTWVAPPTLSLTASSPSAPIGTSVTLTTAGANFPVGYTVRIQDQSGDGTFGGQNTATGSTDPFATQATDNRPQTVIYQAVVMDSAGAPVITSNTVSVTWQQPFLSGGIVSGIYLDPGYPGSSKAPTNMWLSADMNNPSILYAPSDFWLPYLQQHGWDGNEADLHESLGQAMGGAIDYQPDVNSAPQAGQATGSFVAPSGKTYYLYGFGQSGLNPWGATPWVWVRPESGFGFRFLWQGTAANPPVGGTVTWTLVNPDGASRTWSTNFQNTATGPAQWVSVDSWMHHASPIEESRTMIAELNSSTLKIMGQAAAEYISAYTSVPHYVFVGGGSTSNGNNIETAAWSLSSSAATAQVDGAQINVEIQLQLKDGTVLTMNQPDMATLWNLPPRFLISIGGDTFTLKVVQELKNNGGTVGIGPQTGIITTMPSGSGMPSSSGSSTSTGTITTAP